MDTPCQFPFISNGKIHYTCTYDDYSQDFHGQPWCSVEKDPITNEHIPFQYGICDDFEACKEIPTKSEEWRNTASPEEKKLVQGNESK